MKMKVEIGGQTYQVEVEDIHARPVIAVVDGEKYEVWPETETASPARPTSAPMGSAPKPIQSAPSPTAQTQGANANVVMAPLPGVIVAIQVRPGDIVSRSQELCTLEAMKMKNAIRANRSGTIASIDVNVGDQVGHGQVLMTYKV